MGWISDAISGAVQVGVGVLGAKQADKANEKAAKEIEKANEKAAATIQQGNAQALEIMRRLEAEGQPGVARLTEQTLRPEADLTGSQQQFLEDQNVANRSMLASAGMRGAGRGGAASAMDAQRRARLGFFDANRAQGDAAARTLAGRTPQALMGAARIQSDQGSQLARLQGGTGLTNADVEAARGTNRGQITGALGAGIPLAFDAVYRVLSEDRKRKQQQSSFSGARRVNAGGGGSNTMDMV